MKGGETQFVDLDEKDWSSKKKHCEKDVKGEGKLGDEIPTTKKMERIKNIWTGGGPPADIEVRKIKIPRKRRTKKEIEEQRKNDIKGGEFVKKWCREPTQAPNSKIEKEGSKIRNIK